MIDEVIADLAFHAFLDTFEEYRPMPETLEECIATSWGQLDWHAHCDRIRKYDPHLGNLTDIEIDDLVFGYDKDE